MLHQLPEKSFGCASQADFCKFCKHQTQGFSLAELLTALAIAAILAAFVWPAYQSHVCHSARSIARAELRSCALQMERHFNLRLTYEGAVCRDETNGLYRLEIISAGSLGFELRALPDPPGQCEARVLRLAEDGILSESQ